jgi:hypothetical protein
VCGSSEEGGHVSSGIDRSVEVVGVGSLVARLGDESAASISRKERSNGNRKVAVIKTYVYRENKRQQGEVQTYVWASLTFCRRIVVVPGRNKRGSEWVYIWKQLGLISGREHKYGSDEPCLNLNYSQIREQLQYQSYCIG